MSETFEVVRVDQMIVDRESDDDPHFDAEPIIHCFGYDASGDYRHAEVRGFEPYFYAYKGDRPTEAEISESEHIKRVEDYDENGERFESARGIECVKVVTYVPSDVGQIRDNFTRHFESDILFPQRFITDMDLTSGLTVPRTDGPVHISDVETVDVNCEWRVHYTDIEVDDRAGFPENGEQPILCITAYDNFENEYVVWLQGEGEGIDHADESELHDASVDVRWYEREADMLRSYFAYIRATRPAVLTAWNVDFDAEYLIDRAHVLDREHNEDVGLDSISPLGSVSNHDRFGVRVKGMAVFDLLDAFSATQFTELDSYRLDAVAAEFVGDTKEQYVGTIGDLWEENPGKLVDYNLRDVELVVEIDRGQSIIPFWKEVKSIVACQLGDTITESTAADRYILSEYHGDVVFPNQGSASETGESFTGGAVFEPISGIREYVNALDLASLYPMSMLTLNASPETKVDPEEFDGETVQSPNGIHFRQDEDGLTRQLITDLLERRNEKKDQRDACDPGSDEYGVYDRQQRALKVIMNCFSGDTDVLTPDGVRNIKEIDVGDEVYSINPETGDVEIKPVVDTTVQQNQYGRLEHIETQHTDLKITPNHRMVTERDGDISIDHFDDLPRGTTNQIPTHNPMDGDGIETISLLDDVIAVGGRLWFDPGEEHGRAFRARLPDALADAVTYGPNRRAFRLDKPSLVAGCGLPDDCEIGVQAGPNHATIPLEYDADDWLELLAWTITEGSFNDVVADDPIGSAVSYRGASKRVCIAQTDEGGVARIANLLERMGVNYTCGSAFDISNTILYERLAERVGVGSESKQIPNWVFERDLSPDQYERFFRTLVRGDGDSTGDGRWRYTTKSDQLRDDVTEIAVRAGYKPQYTEGGGCWRIYCNRNKGSFIKGRSTSSERHNENVYCVTVEGNHTVMAGRNGKLQWTGNTLYGVLSWSRFRLYDQDVAAAVTATGRECIGFTDDVAQDEGFEVLYGDTDSVLLDMSVVEPDPDHPIPDAFAETHPGMDEYRKRKLPAIIDRSHELEDVINERYDEYASSVLDADEHWFDIEFEKLYERYFQAGKKKRYAGSIVWKEGKVVDSVDVTGFEYVRSDHSALARETQKKVIDLIVDGADRNEVLTYIDGVLDDWDDRKVRIADIGIPEGIGKDMNKYDTETHPVRAAKMGNLLLGTTLVQGSKPKRYYLDDVNPELYRRMEEHVGLDPTRDRTYEAFKRDPWIIGVDRAEELATELVLDWDEMRRKNLKEPLKGVLRALDVDWEEILADTKQTGLHEYGDD